jgi:hypothetical protein
MDGLGFVCRPLYLLGAGIEHEDLNDDEIGRVMDKLYKYRLTIQIWNH